MFLHVYINLALRSHPLSSLALILFSSTARNVLVLCEVSAYANRPVMWTPKYDESLQANCQTVSFSRWIRTNNWRGSKYLHGRKRDGGRKSEGEFWVSEPVIAL